MANPQKENGYTAIANDIMDALSKTRISGEARQVLDYIFRKTYGYNKKEDAISLSQFSLGTGMKKNTICKAICKLVEMNLITKKVNEKSNLYRFNKDFEKWKPLPKKGKYKIVTKKGKGITKKGNESLPKKGHTKVDITKVDITKANSELSSQVQKILDLFYKTINPEINFGNKTSRNAAEWLIIKHGYEAVETATKYAIQAHDKPYAPVITTPYQLKENLAKLRSFYAKDQNKQKQKLTISSI